MESISNKLEEPFVYRVFISYSRQDKILVEQIVEILKQNGLHPMWDKEFSIGEGFHEQIQNFISYAHVFLPVLTKNADERKWVHQEIGYANALRIPILPMMVGELNLPEGMIQQIQAVKVDPENLETIKHHLSLDNIKKLSNKYAQSYQSLFSCAQFPEDRARLMSLYADEVTSLGIYDVVRQKGGLSSFHIPTETVKHQVWERRYGTVQTSEEHRMLQRRERLSLQKHANGAGCKLIINPTIKYERYGKDARLCRLEYIVKFLKEMNDDQCWVAINNEMESRVSTTIIGNWYAAESLAGLGGSSFSQTIFTKHAPTIMEKIIHFDDEFDELLEGANISKKNESRSRAINELEKIMVNIKSGTI